MTKISLKDFLTPTEIKKSIRLLREHSQSEFVNKVCEKVIAPNMGRINKKLGQECDPKFLAYAILYALTQVMRPGKI